MMVAKMCNKTLKGFGSWRDNHETSVDVKGKKNPNDDLRLQILKCVKCCPSKTMCCLILITTE